MTDKQYTTKAKVEAFLGETIAGDISDFILAIQQYIDNYTKRNFKADSVASTRLFDGYGENWLLIDDCVEVTKVEIGNDAWGDSFTEKTQSGIDGYILFPNNYSAKGLAIKKILLKSGCFTIGRQNNRITAKWGYSVAVPADISWIATLLVSSVYKTGTTQNVSGISAEKIGDYSINFKTENELSDFNKAKKILDSYKKYII